MFQFHSLTFVLLLTSERFQLLLQLIYTSKHSKDEKSIVAVSYFTEWREQQWQTRGAKTLLLRKFLAKN